VFFSNLMKPAIGVEAFFPKVIALFIAFAVFASVTFAILMVMDVLECFLHTVRLHWVEF
jgi:V-type H+-transporting ATPase subunit a